MSRFRKAVLVSAATLMVAISAPVLAQGAADSCDNTEDVGGATLPFSVTGNIPPSDPADFTLFGVPGCVAPGNFPEHVTCITPTNNCTVQFTCDRMPDSSIGNNYVNIIEGACTETPSACATGAMGNFDSATVSLALTAGTQYCTVCAMQETNADMELSMTATAGDCGTLPVTLQTFSIEK